MDKKIQNYLGLTLTISAIIFAISGAGFVKVYSDSVSPLNMRSFSVSGEGEVMAVPDIATFNFGVISQGGLGIEALQNDNSSKVNSAIDFLKSNGIDDQDIKTQNYNLYPRYERDQCVYGMPCNFSDPKIIGYTINQTIDVKIRDFSKIGDVLAGVVKNGANSVSNISFDIDDQDALQNEARDKAIVKAQAKAKEIAKSAGFKVGKLISINEGYSPQSYKAVSGMGIGGSFEDASPSIEPGSQEVIVSIFLVYEIK